MLISREEMEGICWRRSLKKWLNEPVSIPPAFRNLIDSASIWLVFLILRDVHRDPPGVVWFKQSAPQASLGWILMLSRWWRAPVSILLWFEKHLWLVAYLTFWPSVIIWRHQGRRPGTLNRKIPLLVCSYNLKDLLYLTIIWLFPEQSEAYFLPNMPNQAAGGVCYPTSPNHRPPFQPSEGSSQAIITISPLTLAPPLSLSLPLNNLWERPFHRFHRFHQFYHPPILPILPILPTAPNIDGKRYALYLTTEWPLWGRRGGC